MIEGDDPLAVALNDVAALGTDRDRAQIAAIRDRLVSARLRVLVAGEAKRGKSTLVNAFLGQPVLPVGVTPLTAVATTVRYGDNPHAEVRFADGHEEKHPYAALDDLVTERGNPANRRGIVSVTVYVDAPILADGVELVDTPGTGSVFAWDTEAAHEALETMDAAVFVLTADPPVSASEQDLLRRVAELSVTTFVVLNKADYLDEAGLAEAVGFSRQVLGEIPGTADLAGASGAVYPMSARDALTPAGDPGFAAFAADFAAYLKTSRLSDLRLSSAGQARRIAVSLQDEVALTRRAAQMRAGDAGRRVEEFSARLAEVAVHSRDAVAVVSAESGRLLFALNDAADQAVRRLREDVGRQLDELLGGELRAAAPADIERRGHEQLAALVLDSVSTWRDERREQIEEGLARVDARLAGDLKAELDVLRGSAAELLDLDLAVPEPGGRLAEDRSFFFSTGEVAGQTELLAGAIRRSLPGGARPPAGRGVPAPYRRRTGGQPGWPGPGRPAVPAGGGDPRPRSRGRAAVYRWHGTHVRRVADGSRPAPGERRRGRAEGDSAGRTRRSVAPSAQPSRSGSDLGPDRAGVVGPWCPLSPPAASAM